LAAVAGWATAAVGVARRVEGASVGVEQSRTPDVSTQVPATGKVSPSICVVVTAPPALVPGTQLTGGSGWPGTTAGAVQIVTGLPSGAPAPSPLAEPPLLVEPPLAEPPLLVEPPLAWAGWTAAGWAVVGWTVAPTT
jgi:hypothetical protein